MNKNSDRPIIPPIIHEGESDSNLSPNRQNWQANQTDPQIQRLLAEDEKYYLRQSVSPPCLSAIKKAEGLWIEDMSGKRFMDFHGNSVHHIGYGHPRLIAAIKDQLDDLSFSPRRFTCEPAVELAQKLADVTPGDLSKTLLATGGSDAIEMAIKLARINTGRHKTISFWDAFHGAGFGGTSIGGEALFRSGVGPLLPGSEHVAPFACYRCPYGHEDRDGRANHEMCGLACANMVEYVLEKEGDVAAVIAEPVRALPIVPPPGFWGQVRAACNKHGALLIFDEIPNGMGRTGKMFSCEHFDTVPDILVAGKSLGGGIIPIAAMIARPDLDVAHELAIGHYTHEKNPVSCRAALTTIQIIEDEGLIENAATVGAYGLERLHHMKDRHAIIGDVRGLGMIMGLDLVKDRESKEPYSDAADRILYRCLENGLSFKTSMGNVLTLYPPLIATKADMDHALSIIDDAIAQEV
ncbi:MAG: aspartate aminotransferase family protein [Rhodospirillales bacterium]|nr:aspartate aminotransferase family protein [Rhodospirillales bacterium]